MDTLKLIFYFTACSLMLGLAKYAIFNLKWREKLKGKLPTELKRFYRKLIIFGFLGFAFFALGSYLSGSLDALDLAAAVISGYFCGYALVLKTITQSSVTYHALLIPLCLLLAVLFDSPFFAGITAFGVLLFFYLRRDFLMFVKAMEKYREKNRQAMKNLLKDVMREGNSMYQKDDKFFLMTRPEILEIVANTIIGEMPCSKIKTAGDINENISWSEDLELDFTDLEVMRVVWEEIFVIDIADSDINKDKIKTIKDVIDMIESKICWNVDSEQSGCNTNY